MNNITRLLLVVLFIIILPNCLSADNLVFDSFEAAKAAAEKRSKEYDAKMDQHIEQMKQEWEQQQKDLANSSSFPDIKDITTKTNSSRTSDSDAADAMQQHVSDSLNDLKNNLLQTVGANSTGFGAAVAGYQWNIKPVDGKYILSDSYDEAAFLTGSGKKAETGTESLSDPLLPSTSEQTTKIANLPTNSTPQNTQSPMTKQPTTSHLQPTSGDSNNKGPSSSSSPIANSSTTSSTPQNTTETPKTEVYPDSAPIEAAPEALPPPAVRLVIEHPTEYIEETFSANTDSQNDSSFKLQNFSIPENTRTKISLELSKDVDPSQVSLKITDQNNKEGTVTATNISNFRHQFKVPSENAYFANVYIKNPETNTEKKIMQVAIPVSSVDFDTRTLEQQYTTDRTDRTVTSNSSSLSSLPTSALPSSSTSGSNSSFSSFHTKEPVDLSRFYSNPSVSPKNQSSNSSAPDQITHSSPISSSVSASDSNQQQDSFSIPSNLQNHTDKLIQGESLPNNDYTDKTNHDEAHQTQPSYSQVASNQQARIASTQYQTSSSLGKNQNATYSKPESFRDHDVRGDINQLAQEQIEQKKEYAYHAPKIKDSYSEYYTNINQIDNNERNEDDEEEEDDGFILGISLRSTEAEIYQSFDFTTQSNHQTVTIPLGTELSFNIITGNTVDIDSLQIELSNSATMLKNSINELGASFNFSFPNKSNASYVRIHGKTDSKDFNYVLLIPVE